MKKIKIIDENENEKTYKFEIKCSKNKCCIIESLKFFVSYIVPLICFIAMGCFFCKFSLKDINCQLDKICTLIFIIVLLICFTVFILSGLKYISKKEKLVMLECLSGKIDNKYDENSLYEYEKIEEAVDKSDEKNSENKKENEPSKKNAIKQKNLGGELYKKIIDSITEV